MGSAWHKDPGTKRQRRLAQERRLNELHQLLEGGGLSAEHLERILAAMEVTGGFERLYSRRVGERRRTHAELEGLLERYREDHARLHVLLCHEGMCSSIVACAQGEAPKAKEAPSQVDDGAVGSLRRPPTRNERGGSRPSRPRARASATPELAEDPARGLLAVHADVVRRLGLMVAAAWFAASVEAHRTSHTELGRPGEDSLGAAIALLHEQFGLAHVDVALLGLEYRRGRRILPFSEQAIKSAHDAVRRAYSTFKRNARPKQAAKRKAAKKKALKRTARKASGPSSARRGRGKG